MTLLGWSWAGWALLASAALLCLILIGVLARSRSFPSTGAGFLVVVALQSLAVLAASLARQTAITWPALIAVVPLVVGLCAYAFVLARFDLLQLRVGAGDHWIAGGAIAISTLACAAIAQATGASHAPVGIHDPLRIASLVLWALTIAWLPALIGAEVRWGRPSYDVRRWATVFPLGMYSVMSSATGSVAAFTRSSSPAMTGAGLRWAPGSQQRSAWRAASRGRPRHGQSDRSSRGVFADGGA